MITASRVWLALACFLVATGLVYGLTSHERAGSAMLLVASVTFGYLAVVAVNAVRRARRPETGEAAGEVEIHIAPTIWPFGFSLAAVGLAVGIVVSPWLIVVGAVLFVLSALGWYRDVRSQHEHAPPA